MRVETSRTLYRALIAKDRRFDGRFFVGVTSTGIYCRPVCSARTPRFERCRFFGTAALAEAAGFRACLKCRPEVAPGQPEPLAGGSIAALAARRIAAGALNEGSLEVLADSLGVTSRHLRRLMVQQLGVGPVALAQSARLAFAKRLLHDTSLGLAEVAFAAGFQSVRRFNAAFVARFDLPPSALRRHLFKHEVDIARRETVTLRLDYRPPLPFAALLQFVEQRAIPHVERADADSGRFWRAVRLGEHTGWVMVEADVKRPALVATVSPSLLGALVPLTQKLRRLFDLDAQPRHIDDVLRRAPALERSVRRLPGLRVPGAFDGFETAVRAVLGQQISVKAARTLASRLVERFGTPLKLSMPVEGVDSLFPTPRALVDAGEGALASIGLPRARARTLWSLAQAVLKGQVTFDIGAPVDPLRELPGIGEWTAQYIAMRALAHPDAFCASDLGVMRALKARTPRQAVARAERFRPWRAYAVMHLWHSPTLAA